MENPFMNGFCLISIYGCFLNFMSQLLNVLLVCACACLVSCSKEQQYYFKDEGFEVLIQKESDSLYHIVKINEHNDSTFWELPYPVYQCKYADINHDGQKEVIVGVIKPTRMDSISRKRIFVFKHIEDYIRPLWLGSRFGMPVEDFNVSSEGPERLLVMEIEKEKNFAVAVYEWDRFGFKFIKYEKRNGSFSQANSLIHEL